MNCRSGCVLEQAGIYRFHADKAELQSLYQVSDAVWENGELRTEGKASRFEFDGQKYSQTDITGSTVDLPKNTFSGSSQLPSHMTASELKENIKDADSDIEKRRLQIALQKKYATLFLPFIIGLLTAPFALGLERKGRVVSIGYGVALWLVFVFVISAFEQLGVAGTLPPRLAVLAPLMAFSMVGIYLLSRVKT